MGAAFRWFACFVGIGIAVGCNVTSDSTLSTTKKSDKEIAVVAVGHKAPEIAGEDVNGAAFKLGDYRGKVVMLDFWGNW